MKRKEDKNKDLEEDEYSILKDNIYGEDSLLKWMSFNKNVNTTTKPYNLDGIFLDDTHVTQRNGIKSSRIREDSNQSIVNKYSTILSPKKPFLDDMSVLKEANISVKRYFDSLNTIPLKNEDFDSNLNDDSSKRSKHAETLEDLKSEQPIVNSSRISKQKLSNDNKINKKELLDNISQIRGDLSKCKNLLNKKHILANNSNLTTENRLNNDQPSFITEKQEKESKCSEKSIMSNNNQETDKKRKYDEDVCSKRLLDNDSRVDDINLFHSSLIETKKKINKALEDVQKNDKTRVKKQEPIENTVSVELNKGETHFKFEENYKKQINNLEKEIRLKNVEIERLQNKLIYETSPKSNTTSKDLIQSGKEIIKTLRERLIQLEEETKLELQQVLEDNRRLTSEVAGLKKITNKLVDKIKYLKSTKN